MKRFLVISIIALSILLSSCSNKADNINAESIESVNTAVYKNEKQTVLADCINNYILDYEFDIDTSTNYTVIRVFKQKTDGSFQYPFVYAPNLASKATKSTLDMMNGKNFLLAINAGVFDVTTLLPDGIVIQNSKVVCNSASTVHPLCKPLTINSNGDLSYAEPDADANELVKNGIVSAVCGFMPIIIDYKAVSQNEWNNVEHYDQKVQRQIIGQFENGDYAIITCEGRGFQNSLGWSILDAQHVCQKLGLKFAYNLDGGGSTETLLGKKQVNSIYEGTTGRIVPTYIVFNGSVSFENQNLSQSE